MLPLFAGLWFAAPAPAWEAAGWVWPDDALPVVYVTTDDGTGDCLVGVGPGACAAEAAAAFDAWASATCSAFGGIDAGTAPGPADPADGVSQVVFGSDALEPGVLAATAVRTAGSVQIGAAYYGQVVEADILIAADGPWALHDDLVAGAPCDGRVDLRATLAQEVGGLAGLGPSCPLGGCVDPVLRQATMAGVSIGCDVDRATPNEDDASGLAALYGPRGTLSCDASGAPSLLGVAPLTLNCAASADAPLDAVRWTFGDGTEDQGPAVTHTWEEEGTYTVIAELSGTDPSCGGWSHTAERPGYVRVCDRPEAAFRVEHILGVRYAFLNETNIPVVGCVTDVRWAIYKGDRPEGEPFEVRENWEFNYEFPEEGTWTVVLNVGGPAGVTAARVTLDAFKHAGLNPFGCPGQGSAWLLLVPLGLLVRRR